MNSEAERLLAALERLTAILDGLDDLQRQRLKPAIDEAFAALERAVGLLEEVTDESGA